MGYDTTIVIRNDALGQIEKDSNFGHNLARAIKQLAVLNKPIDVPAGYHGNAAQVVESHDSNSTAVVTVGGGHGIMQTMVYGWRHTEDHFKRELLERWAEEMGLKVVAAEPPQPASSKPSL